VNDVLEAQAKVALAHSDMTTFEALMIRAQRAEIVIQQYRVNIMRISFNSMIKDEI